MSITIEAVTTNRRRVWLFAVATLLLALFVVFGATRSNLWESASSSVEPAAGSSAAASSSAAAPMVIDVSVRQPEEYLIVYDRPALDTRLGAMVYLREVGVAGEAVGPDIELGRFITGELASSTSPAFATNPRLIMQGLTGRVEVFYLGSEGPVSVDQFQAGILPRVASVGAIAFQQEGSIIVARDARGQAVASYQVPKPIPPGPGEPTMDGGAVKGIYDPETAFVSTVVPLPEGGLLAFVEGVTNVTVADVTTGRRLDLLGYSGVHTATLAEDGFVYAVVWNGWTRKSTFELVKIDPVALRIVAQQPTGYLAGEHMMLGRRLLATPDGEVFVYLPRLNGKTGVYDSLLYKVDRETAATTVVPLPPALGLDARVGVDGKIYFFGGPAENRVSIYDTVTGELEQDVPWLQAPEGTYVQGVVVR